jgi:uncharacterized protein DUF2000
MTTIMNPLQLRTEVDADPVINGDLHTVPETSGPDGRYDHRAFKMVAIVSSRLDSTVAANTVGHMLVALGARIGPWILGKSRQDADEQSHAALARYPFIMLTSKPGKIGNIVAEARKLMWVTTVDYPEEGYTTTHDDDYGLALGGKHTSELTYIGAALFGPVEAITQLCGKLSLWRPKDEANAAE